MKINDQVSTFMTGDLMGIRKVKKSLFVKGDELYNNTSRINIWQFLVVLAWRGSE